MKIFPIFLFCFIGCVLCKPPSDEARKFKNVLKSCNSNNLTSERVKELVEENVLPWSKDERCFMECIGKAVGNIGSDGDFSLSGAKELNNKRYNGTELELANEVALRCSRIIPKGLTNCEIGFHLPKCLKNENEKAMNALKGIRSSVFIVSYGYSRCYFCASDFVLDDPEWTESNYYDTNSPNNEVRDLRDEVYKLRSQVSRLEPQIYELEAQISRLRSKISSLELELTRKPSEVPCVTTDGPALNDGATKKQNLVPRDYLRSSQ